MQAPAKSAQNKITEPTNWINREMRLRLVGQFLLMKFADWIIQLDSRHAFGIVTERFRGHSANQRMRARATNETETSSELSKKIKKKTWPPYQSLCQWDFHANSSCNRAPMRTPINAIASVCDYKYRYDVHMQHTHGVSCGMWMCDGCLLCGWQRHDTTHVHNSLTTHRILFLMKR